jgi:hypothetical protein
MGHECMIIDSNLSKLSIKKLPYYRKKRDFQATSMEDAVKEYAEIIKTKFSVIDKHFGNNIRIHQTGGLDNRTVFAALMSVGCKPKTMYGIGNSILTNTKREDLIACKAYAEKYDLDLYIMNWENNDVFNIDKWDQMFEQYGFKYATYASSESLFTEYESAIPNYPDFMEFGYFTDHLRLTEWISDYGKKIISLENFVDRFLFGITFKNKGFYYNYDALKCYTMDTLHSYMKLLGIESDITIDNFDQVKWIWFRGGETVMVNLLNDYTSSIAMFSIPDLHEFVFDIPACWRANGKFQVRLIHELYPSTLEIPVFSGCRKRVFNRDGFSLIPVVSSLEKFVRITKKITPSFAHPLLKTLRKLFIKNNQSTESSAIRESLVKIINDDSKYTAPFINTSLVNVDMDVHLLMNYAKYLHGVKILKLSNAGIKHGNM